MVYSEEDFEGYADLVDMFNRDSLQCSLLDYLTGAYDMDSFDGCYSEELGIDARLADVEKREHEAFKLRLKDMPEGGIIYLP